MSDKLMSNMMPNMMSNMMFTNHIMTKFNGNLGTNSTGNILSDTFTSQTLTMSIVLEVVLVV